MVAYTQPIILTLTIPTGATTGERIVIDGVNGVIDIFDTNDIKTVELGNGIIEVGQSGFTSIALTANGTDFQGGQAGQVQFLTGSPNEFINGSVYAFYEQATDFLGTVLDGPSSIHNPGHWEVRLEAGSSFGLQPTFSLTFYDDNSFTTGTSVITAFKRGGTTPQIVVDPLWPIVSDTAWTALPLVNSWVNVGGTFQTAQYRLMPDGTVACRGSIVSGVSTTFATLPAGYRPPATVQLAVGGGATVATGTNLRVGITSAGVMTINGESAIGGSFGLDGVRFSVLP